MKTTKGLSQDSRSLRRDLNPGPCEYKVGVLATRPRRSILTVEFDIYRIRNFGV
jgi:hypothetical protein